MAGEVTRTVIYEGGDAGLLAAVAFVASSIGAGLIGLGRRGGIEDLEDEGDNRAADPRFDGPDDSGSIGAPVERSTNVVPLRPPKGWFGSIFRGRNK